MATPNPPQHIFQSDIWPVLLGAILNMCKPPGSKHARVVTNHVRSHQSLGYTQNSASQLSFVSRLSTAL
jgi:hypothetical protein